MINPEGRWLPQTKGVRLPLSGFGRRLGPPSSRTPEGTRGRESVDKGGTQKPPPGPDSTQEGGTALSRDTPWWGPPEKGTDETPPCTKLVSPAPRSSGGSSGPKDDPFSGLWVDSRVGRGVYPEVPSLSVDLGSPPHVGLGETQVGLNTFSSSVYPYTWKWGPRVVRETCGDGWFRHRYASKSPVRSTPWECSPREDEDSHRSLDIGTRPHKGWGTRAAGAAGEEGHALQASSGGGGTEESLRGEDRTFSEDMVVKPSRQVLGLSGSGRRGTGARVSTRQPGPQGQTGVGTEAGVDVREGRGG